MIYTSSKRYKNIIFDNVILEALTKPNAENVAYIKDIATKAETINPVKFADEDWVIDVTLYHTEYGWFKVAKVISTVNESETLLEVYLIDDSDAEKLLE